MIGGRAIVVAAALSAVAAACCGGASVVTASALAAAAWTATCVLTGMGGRVALVGPLVALAIAGAASLVPMRTAPITAMTDGFAARADAGRRRGADAAPMILELAISLECPRCGETYDRLLTGLRDPIARGDVALVIRHVAHRRAQASAALACWALAAAARGPAEHDRFVRAMIGSRADFAPARLLAGPNADEIGLPGLARDAGGDERALLGVLADDERRIRALRIEGPTPQAALVDRDGAVLGRWGPAIDVDAIARAIAR